MILTIFLFIFILKKINFKKNLNTFKILFIILIIKNISCNYNTLNILILNFKNINISLINGILLIHPFVMYFCYVLFLICTYFFLKNIKKKNNNILMIKKNNDILLKSSFISLLLGSYWAQQELN